ncbi:MAG: Dabb family protein [Bacteroidales bacterium]
MKKQFIHHVYFWLKDPADKAVIMKFEQALKKLVTIDSIYQYHLGKPASTRRDVIDSSYQYSLLTVFIDQKAHDDYQVHPVHDEFRVVAGELCSKVQVYDSIPME